MAFGIKADLILINGRIWRGREEGISEALAVWQGKILATGSDTDILGLKGPRTEVIDLEGRFATPGLIDNHLHLIATGMAMGWVDATPASAPTLAALMGRISDRAATTPKGGWVRARGYDQVKLDTGRHPTRDDLDRVAPDHPVLLTRACGHVSIANSRALELAGITEATAVPEGGVIGVTEGRLNGFLAENAQNLVKAAMPPATTEDLIDGIERAGRYLLSFGITSCMDAAVGQVSGFAEIQAYEMAKLSGRLPVRVWLTLLGDPGVSIVEDCWRAGLLSGAGDDMLRVGGVKVFLDGSAGGRTAWMTRPYRGEPDNIGVQMLPDAEVEAVVKACHDRGYQMVCHAIGDGAIEQLITAYEKALAANPDPDPSRRALRLFHTGSECAHEGGRYSACAADGLHPRFRRQLHIRARGGARPVVLPDRHLDAHGPETVDRLGFAGLLARSVPEPARDAHAPDGQGHGAGSIRTAEPRGGIAGLYGIRRLFAESRGGERSARARPVGRHRRLRQRPSCRPARNHPFGHKLRADPACGPRRA